ncbi:MAG: hypothetical protein ACE5EA_08525 [Nitrospirota bacterium]
MNKKSIFGFIQQCSILTLVLALLIVSGCLSNASGDVDRWERMVKRFLLPLTYPDFDPDDFGKETDEQDKRLLKRYSPDIYISPHGIKPIDFYRDYLPKTEVVELIGNSKRVVKRSPDRRFLKKVERTKGYCLMFTGSFSDFEEVESVGYGQVIREVVRFRKNSHEIVEKPMIFLRYNFVFPKSGLPARLPWYKEIGARILGNPDAWHLLDIHGAIHVVLDETEKPVALILAQHNYHRTYLFRKDLKMPENGRVKISFAERSNEPYPYSDSSKPVFYWAADTPEKMEYILTGRHPTLKTGEDVVFGKNAGAIQVDYKLHFLPDRDPLYTSWIPLGDKLKLFYFFESWYRSGPPGMDLRTWPALKQYGELMQFWYVQNGDYQSASFMKENIRNFFDLDFEKILVRNGSLLYKDLQTFSRIN